jgi:glycosyltransferase involved in cell wall biosynthesis
MPEVAAAAACLVDPFDPSSIRAGILRVIEDAAYRTHLIAEGFENVKRFRADIIAAQYARLYRAVFAVAERRDRARTGAGNTRIEV